MKGIKFPGRAFARPRWLWSRYFAYAELGTEQYLGVEIGINLKF